MSLLYDVYVTTATGAYWNISTVLVNRSYNSCLVGKSNWALDPDSTGMSVHFSRECWG